jgi:hypothetical protein
MRSEYRDGYGPLATIFERMYGVALPQIRNYAPAAFYHVGAERDDGTGRGRALSSAGMRAGFLANRKRHTATPRLENAFATFFGHSTQTAHWKGLAEFVREFSGVIGRPEVKKRDRIGARERRCSRRGLGLGAEHRGQRHSEGIRPSRRLRSCACRRAGAHRARVPARHNHQAVVGNSRSAYKMPLGEYAKGFAKLITGNLDVRKVYESET